MQQGVQVGNKKTHTHTFEGYGPERTNTQTDKQKNKQKQTKTNKQRGEEGTHEYMCRQLARQNHTVSNHTRFRRMN